MSDNQITQELKLLADPEKAKNYARFFKTGPGDYGAGDKFIGVTVPDTRYVASKYKALSLNDVAVILKDPVHEIRLTALIILTYKFPKADPKIQKQIYELYLRNLQYVNNWDLIDLSAPKIVGAYLLDKPEQRTILYQLAKSKNLWEKRVSIISTFAFIKQSNFQDVLQIAKVLLKDQHDLIHKAIGWMLREIGKKNELTLRKFLDQHATKMPRTTLRYAIERLTPKQKYCYMKK